MNRREIQKKIGDAMRFLVSKDVLLFIVFLIISFVFWSLLALNEDVQMEVNIPIRLTNVPDSVTILSDIPQGISANIKAKDSRFFYYGLEKVSPVNLSFNKYKRGGKIILGEAEIRDIIRGLFGSSSQILSMTPDSVNIFFTTLPGKQVKLITHVDATTESQYVISGEIKPSVGTVTVYSSNELPASLTHVETVPVVCNGLDKTTTVKTRIIAPSGTRIVPDTVSITIPVEPLIAKKRNIPVTIINEPVNKRLITFPSQIEVSYMVPMSLFNDEECPIGVCADYDKIDTIGSVFKVPLALTGIPSNYKGVTLPIDSVEYIIEQK